MGKEFWLNLPVHDLDWSIEFFTKIGFTVNTRPGQAQLIIGNGNVMLFPAATFMGFTKHENADPKEGVEVLLSFSADSRDEVDIIAKKAVDAGGTLFSEPEEIEGWMYGCGFADLDGHRWNALYMDMNNMPK